MLESSASFFSALTYKSDGLCILGYGFDSRRRFHALLLLLPNPLFGQVCNRGLT